MPSKVDTEKGDSGDNTTGVETVATSGGREVSKVLDLGDGRGQCSICKKQFRDMAGARRHVSEVHEQEPKCVYRLCSAVLKNKRSLVKHLKTKHNITVRVYQR